MNWSVNEQLGWLTPISVAFGYTPDVSMILSFVFYQKVLYFEYEAHFPTSKEKSGHLVGFSESVGDALTFLVLTDDTQELISQSVVHPAEDEDNPNHCLFLTGGEADTSTAKERQKRSKKLEISSYVEVVDLLFLKLPTVDPLAVIGKTFLMAHEVDGSVHHAEVMRCVESMDSEIEQYLVYLGSRKQEEIKTYDAIVEAIDSQLTSEAEKTDEEGLWIFKEVV
eukprot:15362667-Ditylum_brightwellii.AAC.1